MSAWTVVLLAGVGTYLLRVSIVVAIDRLRAPAGIERLAAYVVPAAFAGLAASALREPVGAGGGEALAIGAAAAVTLAVAGRGRSASMAFTCGLLTLWAVTTIVATV